MIESVGVVHRYVGGIHRSDVAGLGGVDADADAAGAQRNPRHRRVTVCVEGIGIGIGIGIVVCGDPWTGGVICGDPWIGLSAQSSSAAMPEEQGATDHERKLGLKLKKVPKKRKKEIHHGFNRVKVRLRWSRSVKTAAV